MSENVINHATLVSINNKGVLIKGNSGAGKSDLALRLIQNKNAILVADDVVELYKYKSVIFGKSPSNIKGLLEIRGIGIMRVDCLERAKVDLIVNLVDDISNIDRFPKTVIEKILDLEIPKIDLYAKECSAPEKIIVKLNGILLNDEQT